MTVYVVFAALLALWYLSRFGNEKVCARCQGRGAHRKDCPLKDEDRP